MQAKLQELADKIYQEGVGKAQQEADRIISEAKEKSAVIIKEAEKKAADAAAAAEKKAGELKSNVASEIRMAGNQAVSSLKQKIGEMVTADMTAAPLSASFDDVSFIKKLIETVVGNWKVEGGLILELPEASKKELQSYVESTIKKMVDGSFDVVFQAGMASGFKIGPADGGYMVSFTEESFDNFLKDYLRPRAERFLFGEE